MKKIFIAFMLVIGFLREPVSPTPFQIHDIYPSTSQDVNLDEFYSALEAKEKELYWAKIEEERIATEERRYQEYLESLRKTVNFDEYDYVIAPDYPELQYYIDLGYIAYWQKDYWHHNNGKFLELFLSINPGDTVIIGGKEYIADSFEYGIVADDGSAIYGYTTGRNTFLDNHTDIITCNGPVGTLKRQIWHLETK